MTVETLSQTAPGIGVSDPEDMLHLLDELMALPGAQGHHYHVLRQMLTDDRTIESYSLQQLQDLTGKSATTCKAIRRWIADCFPAGRNSDLGQDSAPCIHGTSTCVQHVQNSMHGSESRPLIQQLKDLGWGQKNGRQVKDPEELLQAHGVAVIRQAVEKASRADVKNPAGFVTWYLRRQPSVDPKRETTVAEETPIVAPTLRDPSPDLEPLLYWLRGQVRPQTWQSWFADCRLTRSDTTVTVWFPNPYVRDWVRDQFRDLLHEGVEQIIGQRSQIAFEVYE